MLKEARPRMEESLRCVRRRRQFNPNSFTSGCLNAATKEFSFEEEFSKISQNNSPVAEAKLVPFNGSLFNYISLSFDIHLSLWQHHC